MIEAPDYKTGLFSIKKLKLIEIENEIKKNSDLMLDYSKNLEPGTEKDLFIGTAIVVVSQ